MSLPRLWIDTTANANGMPAHSLAGTTRPDLSAGKAYTQAQQGLPGAAIALRIMTPSLEKQKNQTITAA
ncbi:hypothetical protein [Chitinimonas naiadis]